MAPDDVDRGAAGGEVEHHARRDLGGKGAHSLGGDAVVGRHHGDGFVFDDRRGRSLDAGELDGDRLETAERLGRLGELRLPGLRRTHGIGIERSDGGDRAGEQIGGHWSDSFTEGWLSGDAASAVTSRGKPETRK